MTRRHSPVCVRVCARAPGPFLCLLASVLIPNAARRQVGTRRLLNLITFVLLRFQWPHRRLFCSWWFFVVCVPECRGEVQLPILRHSQWIAFACQPGSDPAQRATRLLLLSRGRTAFGNVWTFFSCLRVAYVFALLLACPTASCARACRRLCRRACLYSPPPSCAT